MLDFIQLEGSKPFGDLGLSQQVGKEWFRQCYMRKVCVGRYICKQAWLLSTIEALEHLPQDRHRCKLGGKCQLMIHHWLHRINVSDRGIVLITFFYFVFCQY